MLLSLIHEVCAPVLRPASFGTLGTERLFLAVADRPNAVRRDSQRHQRLFQLRMQLNAGRRDNAREAKEELQRMATSQGMHTLRDEGIRLIGRDVTTIDEVARVST